jgi:hypothetical protein
MAAISDLDTLLRTMEPVLQEGVYVYARGNGRVDAAHPGVVAFIRETEGLSLVVEESFALEQGLEPEFRCAWITLNVNSDLAAVGLTAAFATALGRAGVSCNVVAGLSHDHIFVPVDQAQHAMMELRALQQGQRANP